jgi:predicted N-acetyltransferase YhbS
MIHWEDGNTLLMRIQPLADVDRQKVETLLDAAFGSNRHLRTAYKLRAGSMEIPSLSFAAMEGDALIGSLQSWPIELQCENRDPEPLVMVGPVAVAPDRQRGGIGVSLMNHMINAANCLGEDAMMLIGDPEYYDRLFNFSAVHTGNWDVPGPVERHRLLARLNSTRLVGRRGMLAPGSSAVGIRATA